MHRVLSEMELASLPGDAREGCFACRGESLVGVADDELDPVHAPVLERAEELAPVNFGLRE